MSFKNVRIDASLLAKEEDSVALPDLADFSPLSNEPETPLVPAKDEAEESPPADAPPVTVKPEEAETDEAWKHQLALPAEDELVRDWSRYNRKLAFMYPTVVLPGWKRKR